MGLLRAASNELTGLMNMHVCVLDLLQSQCPCAVVTHMGRETREQTVPVKRYKAVPLIPSGWP